MNRVLRLTDILFIAATATTKDLKTNGHIQ